MGAKQKEALEMLQNMAELNEEMLSTLSKLDTIYNSLVAWPIGFQKDRTIAACLINAQVNLGHLQKSIKGYTMDPDSIPINSASK